MPITDSLGTKRWYINGTLHREDGPAIVLFNGDKFWYFCGVLHRLDGPAIELANGQKEWFVRGHRHRTDGPAIIWCNNDQEWFINGTWQTQSQIIALKSKELNYNWSKEGF